MSKHEETKGVSPRDTVADSHVGNQRPITQTTSGSLGGASGSGANSPKK